MASNYPTSLDDFTNPNSTSSLDSPSHSLQHSDINDAVEALEAKLGIGASPAGSATAGQVLTAQGGGTALWETGALTYINTFSSGSAVATFSVNDVFSSEFSNYRIVIQDIKGSTTPQQLRMRLRASGSDETGSNYAYQRLFGQSTGTTVNATVNSQNGQDHMTIGSVINALSCFYIIDLFRPQKAEPTYGIASGIYQGEANRPWHEYENFMNNLSTAYTGFTIYAASGNIDVQSIKIYGYKD